MPKTYRIKLLIDASQARAAAKQSAADAQALDKAWLRAAQSMEGAFARAARAAGGAGKAFAPDLAPFLAAMGKARADADRLGASLKKGSADWKRAQADAVNAGLAGLRRLGAGADEFGGKFRRAAHEGEQGIDGAGDATARLLTGLKGLAVGSLVLSGLRSVAEGVTGAIAGANAESQRQLDILLATKEGIREIMFMIKGFGGVTYTDLKKHLDLRAESGLGAPEAKAFSTEFHGAAEAARDVKIPSKELDRAEPMLAKAAATLGGGAEGAGARGKLGGLLAGARKYDKAEDLLADVMRFEKTIGAGVGADPILIREAMKVAGSMLEDDEMRGRFKTPGELAAAIATASRVAPGRSADTIKSEGRVLYGGKDKKWAPLLRSAGIEEADSLVDREKKLFAKMEEAEKAGRDPMSFLTDSGVDVKGAESVTAMYKYRALSKKLLEEAAKPYTGEDARRDVDKAFREDASLPIKAEEAKLEREKVLNAEKLERGRLLDLEARRRLEGRGEGDSSAGARAEDYRRGLMSSHAGLSLPPGMTAEELGRKIRIEEEKFRIAGERGVGVPGRPRADSSAYPAWVWSGEADAAYASAADELDLRARTGTAKPAGKVAPKAPATWEPPTPFPKPTIPLFGPFGPTTWEPPDGDIPGKPEKGAWGPEFTGETMPVATKWGLGGMWDDGRGIGEALGALGGGGVDPDLGPKLDRVAATLDKILLALRGPAPSAPGRFSPAEMPGTPPSLPGGPRAGSIRPGGMTA